MESLVERPQVQLMRDVKKTFRMERREAMRSYGFGVGQFGYGDGYVLR